MIRTSRGLAVALVAVVTALGIGQAVLQNYADAQDRSVDAPRFEVDALWPKPLPNHWVIGRGVGVWVDDQDHVWVVHTRQQSPRSERESARAQGRPGAARPRRRCLCSTRPAISCAPGAGRALDTNGRQAFTAFTSITRATSGSAAMVRRTRTSSSSRRTASS